MSYNVLEIHLEKLASDRPVSFKNMDITQLKQLKNAISKLIDIEKETNDLEVTFEDGSWKIILLSAALSLNNPAAYSTQLKSFSKYINSNFIESKISFFRSSDKLLNSRSDIEDLSDIFGQVITTRTPSIDTIQFLPIVQIDDISVNGEITYTIENDIKTKLLRNGLSSYFDNLTFLEIKSISKSRLYLCTIDTKTRYKGIVGIFSSLEAKNLYSAKYNEILSFYNDNFTEDRNDVLFNTVSNHIIDFFEEKYVPIIFHETLDLNALRDLHSFLSLFVNRNFDKQIHVNILTYLSFIEPSVLTISLKQALMDYHFPKL